MHLASILIASQVASNIETLTSMSRDIQTHAKELTAVDRPLLVASQGDFPVRSVLALAVDAVRLVLSSSFVFADRVPICLVGHHRGLRGDFEYH